jgi:hypothetical protein
VREPGPRRVGHVRRPHATHPSRATRTVLAAAAVAALAATASVITPAAAETTTPTTTDADRPMAAPQYLIHITGHGTTSGDVKDDAWIVHPSEPDAMGNFLVADGSGGTYGYGSDSHSGPYTTRREVCAAAQGKTPDGYVVSFSGSVDTINCNNYGLGPATTTTSTSTTTASTTTTTGATTTTVEPAPTCTPHGLVIDRFGVPVPDIHVSLRAGGLELETATLDDGSYSFPEIGDDPGGGVFDSRTDSVTIAVSTEEWVNLRYIVYYQQLGAVLRSDPFLISASPDCVRDFDMAAIPDTYSTINGPPLYYWPDIMQIYQGIHRAWALADLLDLDLDYGLPLSILAWCNDPALGCDGSDFAFFVGTTSNGLQVKPKPYIAFGESTSTLLDLGWPDNREYHEFGHFVQAALFDDAIPDHDGNRNHAGYANPSSSDAWTEGFAEFWSVMVSKYIEQRPRPYIYTWNQGLLHSNSPNAPPHPGSDLSRTWRAWYWPEEFAVASLLIELESYDIATSAVERPKRNLRVDGYTTIVDPSYGELLVGTVTNLTPDGSSVGTAVLAAFSDGNGRTVDGIVGHTVPATLGPDGGQGVFVLPVRPGLQYEKIEVFAYEGSPPAPQPPPPPLKVTLRELMQLIVSGGSNKDQANGHIFDVDDLYQTLKATYGGQGEVQEGLDSIDRLFVAHGFHDDSDGDRKYAAGDTIGLTSHPPLFPREDCPADSQQFGCQNRAPRHDLRGKASQSAAVDTGAVDAHVYVQVRYPTGQSDQEYGYLLAPDETGHIEVVVPPPDSGASLVLIALADGHEPRVLGTIEADAFWQRSDAAEDQPFLSFTATLPDGDFTFPSGEGATPAARPSTPTSAGAATTGGGSGSDGGNGLLVAVVIAGVVALGGALLLGRRRQIGRPAGAPPGPGGARGPAGRPSTSPAGPPRMDGPIPTAPAPPGAPTTLAFAPTHVVPLPGLDGYRGPDAATGVQGRLPAGTPVTVIEARGSWARVLCSNGWTAWVDGRPLEVIHP